MIVCYCFFHRITCRRTPCPQSPLDDPCTSMILLYPLYLSKERKEKKKRHVLDHYFSSWLGKAHTTMSRGSCGSLMRLECVRQKGRFLLLRMMCVCVCVLVLRKKQEAAYGTLVAAGLFFCFLVGAGGVV